MSIGRYFTEMLDPSMTWNDVAEMVRKWNGPVLPEGRDVGRGREARGRRSAAPASFCRIMAGGSSTDRAHRSISWRKSSMPSAIGWT